MHNVLVMGAGKIGSLIAFLLARSNDYSITLADNKENNPHAHQLQSIPDLKYIQLDATNTHQVSAFLKKNQIEAVISSLPYYCNIPLATVAASLDVHYFDLTEDVETTRRILELTDKPTESIFVPQCGLAPGIISVITHHLMQQFP